VLHVRLAAYLHRLIFFSEKNTYFLLSSRFLEKAIRISSNESKFSCSPRTNESSSLLVSSVFWNFEIQKNLRKKYVATYVHRGCMPKKMFKNTLYIWNYKKGKCLT
jgi:hypothetical protein